MVQIRNYVLADKKSVEVVEDPTWFGSSVSLSKAHSNGKEDVMKGKIKKLKENKQKELC